MAVHERARRSFVIHVFAGLAAAGGCRHDDTAGAPPAPSSSPARAVAPADTGVRATPDARIDTTTDASIADASNNASDAGSDVTADAPSPPDWRALNRPIRESDVHLPPSGISPFGPLGTGPGGGGRMGGGGGTTGDSPLGSIGARGNAGGAGGLGMGMGTGLGYGVGSGSFRGRTVAMPTVRVGQIAVTGSLPREIVRRVTLRNINQLRFCYEQALTQRPDLHGSIIVRYLIGPQGTVVGAAVDSTNITVASVPQCYVSAVRRWQFPAPDGGGSVTVVSLFNLNLPGE